MKVRGERECQSCGTQWSYYETGEPSCPECGSLRSVGIEERALHTDTPAELDLTRHRDRFGEARGTLPSDGVTELKRDLRAYVHKRGFIRGGEPLPLDDIVLAAHELLQAVDLYDHLTDPTDEDRQYLTNLLSGADKGTRPATDDVPPAMREAHGIAVANAVEAYREDLRTYLDDHPNPGAREVLGSLRERVKRLESLQGDVDPAAAEVLVQVANDVGAFLRGDHADAENEDSGNSDTDHLERARKRIAELDP